MYLFEDMHAKQWFYPPSTSPNLATLLNVEFLVTVHTVFFKENAQKSTGATIQQDF